MYLINKDETEHTGQVNVVLFLSLSKKVFLKQTIKKIPSKMVDIINIYTTIQKFGLIRFFMLTTAAFI